MSCLSLSGSNAPTGLTKTVSDRANGLNQVGLLFAELGPQPADMNVDRACPAVVLVAPHPAQQRLAREDLAGMDGEELQQLVLHVRQVERPPVDCGLVRLEVEDERAVFDELGSRAASGSPEEMLETGVEFERL